MVVLYANSREVRGVRRGARLSPYVVTRIRQLIREGEQITLVAERMQVTQKTVRKYTEDLRGVERERA